MLYVSLSQFERKGFETVSSIQLHRLGIKEASGWRVIYFASEAEAEISERAASIAGQATMLQTVNVPTDPQRLAEWLSDHSEARP